MKKQLLEIYSFFQSLSGFKKFGSSSIIKKPTKIWNKNCIEIGDGVFVAENGFLAVSCVDSKKPLLKIGNGVCIGSNFMAACVDEIVIENNVLISDRVFIADHIHDYHDTSTPIIKQKLVPKGKVLIREGAFIGINAVIMPGVTIGKNSVVGASSVVLHNIPDFSVATGNPAKVVKKYDIDKKEWIKQAHE
ncbi:MAG: acyltransferase [Patescibacteria group bacterium]|nr:acyltransferase [Patescibacteria group bacterium]